MTLYNYLQVSLDDKGRPIDPIYLYAQQQHIFAEGPDFLLSDAILYPQMYLIMEFIQSYEALEAKFRQLMPKTYAWFNRVNNEIENATQSCRQIVLAASRLIVSTEEAIHINNVDLEWPQNVPNQSLYKSDRTRRNPNARIFTRQPDIDKAMAQVFETSNLHVS